MAAILQAFQQIAAILAGNRFHRAKIQAENHLTTLMITHNMKDAIRMGNRLIMMHDGRVIYDVAGEEKKNLEVYQLLEKFEQAAGEEFANDRMMLN